MKYAMLIGDGMADWPVAALGNRTPLEYADTPNMDRIAATGTLGLVATVPPGMNPGSDVANLSLLGYDPMSYYSGRAPIEAASMGISLGEEDTAFRCNLVTIENGAMIDYSAGHISTEDASEIVTALQRFCSSETIRFFTGKSYRHLMVARAFPDGLTTTPPHDITGKPVMQFLPQGEGAQELAFLSNKAHDVLAGLAVNEKRIADGKRPVTDVWFWGQGKGRALPTLAQRFGITGSVVSAVDLVMGLGVLAGLSVRHVEGATGYLGTNYAGKVAAAVAALDEEDFVYLHVEAPDETGHEGDLQKKVLAIEEFDRCIVGEMLALQEHRGDLRMIVTPDHPTPLAVRTHCSDPVPFALCGPGVSRGGYDVYTELAAQECDILTGPVLFNRFIRQAW